MKKNKLNSTERKLIGQLVQGIWLLANDNYSDKELIKHLERIGSIAFLLDSRLRNHQDDTDHHYAGQVSKALKKEIQAYGR